MRRKLIAALAAVALIVAGVVVQRVVTRKKIPTEVLGIQVTPPAKRIFPENRAKGLVYRGLEETDKGPCKHILRTKKSGRCTHGPDAAPEGVDVTVSRPKASSQESGQVTAASGGGVVCEGDGVVGKRIHGIYAHALDPGATDRYADYLSSFRTWAARVDTVFQDSAALTGGIRRPRFVTDAGCNVVVDNVTLAAGGLSDIDTMISLLEAQGYDRSDRTYLVWADSTVYCGIATMWIDDSPGAGNANNTGPSYARVDSGCWGYSSSVESHEVMHNLGGVQPSAPNATPYGHCTDEYDRMCYDDDGAGPVQMQQTCTDVALDRLFDCNGDDYFNTSPTGGYLTQSWNVANSGFLISSALAVGQLNPLVPVRILDTRTGLGAPQAQLNGPQTINVQVTGQGGVPSSGVSAVVLNVAIVAPTMSSYATVFPNGRPRPLAASVNWAPGQTISNLVTAKIGEEGKVSAYIDRGRADLVFDVAGWYSESASGASGRYRPLTPARLLDTRSTPGGALTSGTTIELDVAGRGGVPENASAVVLNLAATNTTLGSHLRVFPVGESRPTTANLNWAGGDTIANRVVAKLGTGGNVNIYLDGGIADVVADVGGWFTDASGAETPPGLLGALSPARVLDTRTGLGAPQAPLGGGGTLSVLVAGQGGVPQSGATAVVMNVAVTNTSTASHLTIYPSDVSQPLAADLNFAPGQTISNNVVVKLGADGRVKVFLNAGAADVIWDVVGYFN